jgi:hypothetical protein
LYHAREAAATAAYDEAPGCATIQSRAVGPRDGGDGVLSERETLVVGAIGVMMAWVLLQAFLWHHLDGGDGSAEDYRRRHPTLSYERFRVGDWRLVALSLVGGALLALVAVRVLAALR